MKQIFVAATRQNHGKTTVALGLFSAFQRRFNKVAYLKPVGQQYKLIEGKKIDKDAVLFRNVYNLPDRLEDMSPIAVPSGFTTNYILNGKKEVLANKIHNAYNALTRDKHFILIEGTGHAGVGSVFDMSNADVAKMFGSKVLLVAEGGIGRPIDEIIMNKSLFDQRGVEIIGVIVNKVKPQKYDRISEMVRAGFAKFGIKVFGVIPSLKLLKSTAVVELVEDLGAELLFGDKKGLQNNVSKFVIGDMLPHAAVDSLIDNSLLIVPGNRDSIILAALCESFLESGDTCNVAAMVFTNGIRPHRKIMELIKKCEIPSMLVQADSYKVASRINNSIFKLRAEEHNKIKQCQEMVEEYVDLNGICECL